MIDFFRRLTYNKTSFSKEVDRYMARVRGYSSYRGKTPRWKILLAVLLCLVIVAAVVVIFLQRFMIYDEMGRPQFLLPGKTTEQTETVDDLPELELDVEPGEPEAQPEEVIFRAAAAADNPMTGAAWQSLQSQMTAGGWDGLLVTLKDSTGRVYFDSREACSGTVTLEADTTEALSRLLVTTDHAIARISCFHDPKAANGDVENMGLKNTGGYIFYDGNNSQWLDPAKPAAREYLCRIAAELAALGFDEILLTDVSYPLVGKLDKVAYGETPKEENMRLFLQEMAAALAEYEVKLSVQVPAELIAAGRDDTAGLVLADVAAHVDRIYAETTAEQAPALAEAVSAVEGSAVFVPIVTVAPADGESSFLLQLP